MNWLSLFPTLLALILSPLLLGVINRVKAIFSGRQGPPLMQPYWDLLRLLQKGAVYSTTTTWVFRAGPIIALAVIIVTLTIIPLGNTPAPLKFGGDIILLAYLFGLARFLMISAALDTGSSFEGMGASREGFFSALAEPALVLGLAAVARETSLVSKDLQIKSLLSLSDIHGHLSLAVWQHGGLMLSLVAVALFVIFLAENSRIPFDDPTTHLELTMIHEVMVLDHSGPDLAYILYAKALKVWALGALIVELVVPAHTGSTALDLVISVGGIFLLAVAVGVVESTMARLQLLRVPQLLIGATALAGLALVLEYRG